MKKYVVIIALCFIAAACGSKKEQAPALQESPQKSAAPAPTAYSGTVLSTKDASNYTYLEIQGAEGVFWAAVPRTTVKQGDKVELQNGAVMNNFEAKVLGRKFDTIVFAGGVVVNGKQTEEAANMPPAPAMGSKEKQQEMPVDAGSHMKADTAADASGVKRAAGGVTIAEILAKPAAYKDKKIVLQAKVTKFLPEIMKKNWLHLKDASVKDTDIVATSAQQFKVGDVVLLEGTVKTDQDFGFGYKYAVLVEEVKKK
jgi:hypothetical protein